MLLCGLGHDPVDVGVEALYTTIHPEDRTTPSEARERALREDTSCATEFRRVLPDGSIRWYRNHGRRIYATQLRHWGFETVAVETAFEALELLRRRRFDLALFDFEMPETNGLELAQRVASLRLAPQTRIILCSSSGVTRAELHGTAGDPPFHAYLHKPTRTDHFREVVGRLLEGAPVSLDRRGAMDVDSSLAQQHPLRILLAEDNVVNQKVGVALLNRMGYQPDVVANGLEVLAAVRRQTYDVILMDIQMPEMDGLEASRRHVACRRQRAAAPDRTDGECLQDRSRRVPRGWDGRLLEQAAGHRHAARRAAAMRAASARRGLIPGPG